MNSREQKGAGKPFILTRLREKVEVLGPAVDLARLNTSISIAITDRIGSSWDEWYGRLKAYKQREGHCHVPTDYCEQGYCLGGWVSHQRDNKERMSPERRAQLDTLGFVWDPFAAQWEEGVGYFERYRKDRGDGRMPDGYRDPTSGYRLGQWVAVQRHTQENIPPEWRQRLDALGFVWDVRDVQWEEGVDCLKRYRERGGDGLVPALYRDPASGYGLGRWVSRQRHYKDTLLPERRAQLDTLGFVWDPFAAQWEEGVGYFERYRKDRGDGRVPYSYRDPVSGYRLGQWVRVQRTCKDTMSPERRQRLDALKFVWKVH